MTLEIPSSSQDLYLAQGPDVELHRPLLTGDVIAGVTIPGVEDGEGLAFVAAHPCTMRRGPDLRSHVLMCRVNTFNGKITDDTWNKNFRVMPLPDLMGADHVATFELMGRVRTEAIDLSKRQACLSAEGITLFMQRLTFSFTRTEAPTETIHRALDPVLEEVDAMEEWAIVAFEAGQGEQLREFDDFIMADRDGGPTVKEMLADPRSRALARRLIRDERQKRFGQ